MSIVMAAAGLLSCHLPQSAKAQPSHGASGVAAREAMTSIFDRRDPSAVDRFFAAPFVQHDPNIADGLAGLRRYAADIAASLRPKIEIYRTLEDGDLVLLHSKYQGLNGQPAPLAAFDLFRFKDGKIVEHWGGQEPEAPPNPSGHTQVDGPVVAGVKDTQVPISRISRSCSTAATSRRTHGSIRAVGIWNENKDGWTDPVIFRKVIAPWQTRILLDQ
jgi:predicted SnoaL-like aldol condensation-catalyzing enzyme